MGMFAFSSGSDCSASQRGNTAPRLENGVEMGWWDGGYHFLCTPKSCPCPGVVSTLGWPWGTWQLLNPWPLTELPVFPCSPCWHRYWNVPFSLRILPPPPSFFFSINCLKLISSSSAHHSSLFDDTYQVVGGFVMAVSDTLIKAISFSRRNPRTI